MRSDLSIEGTGTGLRARVEAPTDILRIVMTAAGACLFIYLFARRLHSIEWPALIFFAILVISLIGEIFRALRGTDVELHVENLNFTSSGHAPGGYRPGFISREDLLRLEFRKASGGGDFPECPRGLYVEYSSDSASETSICVLLHIDEQQSQEVIQAIRLRFPEIDQLTYPRAPKSDLISLHLN
jgi:hypothetical protein